MIILSIRQFEIKYMSYLGNIFLIMNNKGIFSNYTDSGQNYILQRFDFLIYIVYTVPLI